MPCAWAASTIALSASSVSDLLPPRVISLFAVHGPAAGVVTEGLVYPLRGETLEPGSTRGISNVFAETEAHVRLEHGVLLAVRPIGTATAGS